MPIANGALTWAGQQHKARTHTPKGSSLELFNERTWCKVDQYHTLHSFPNQAAHPVEAHIYIAPPLDDHWPMLRTCDLQVLPPSHMTSHYPITPSVYPKGVSLLSRKYQNK